MLEIPLDQRVGLKVRNLSVAVKSKVKNKDPHHADEKDNFNVKSSKILNDISFDVNSGELIALMGVLVQVKQLYCIRYHKGQM